MLSYPHLTVKKDLIFILYYKQNYFEFTEQEKKIIV